MYTEIFDVWPPVSYFVMHFSMDFTNSWVIWEIFSHYSNGFVVVQWFGFLQYLTARCVLNLPRSDTPTRRDHITEMC